jgi:photosystem II stability/assembly factor-like uncharacterized protein
MERRMAGLSFRWWSARRLALLASIVPALAFAQAKPKSQAKPTPEKKQASDSDKTKSDSASGYKGPFTNDVFSGIKARNIGPAVTSGRIMSIAVHPTNHAIIYVGSASGGVWKTVNGGASWQPLFDSQGSFSIGWVTLDPKNPNVVWVGTGEGNSQRSVAYGDGVYKSEDGGKTWKNMGLKNSEHISRIVIDPKNSNIVYVAAQGPLWAPGGDRGLYKTTDGGKTWEQILKIGENTGVSDVVLDPRNPDIVIASSYQRRRHQWTLIDGGPESGVHRSTDGGKTWTKLSGFGGDELGRIGLAVSPANPDVVYALAEAANNKGAIYRSNDDGVTWEKRSDYNQGSMYYGSIFADPFDVDRIYVMDVVIQVSDDGGRTTHNIGFRYMHVDMHVIWVDPTNRDHYLVGNDGGVYQSWDGAATWVFFPNLPVTQFYDVDVDNDLPFYNVMGGTQDNYSLRGPAHSRSSHGIMNQDWIVTQGGDGFVSRPDPKDPNIVYAEAQHGVIVRNDLRTGERVGVQPQEDKNDAPARWNWDTPFIISAHNNHRLYMASQFLYRSDDMAASWKKISPDLTRKIDVNTLPVMGKIWGPDAVAKNTSTALYSNISAIAESPKNERLLYVGTDDGLIQASEDGGTTWRKVENFPGVTSERPYVSRVKASVNDERTVYATLENHQSADFTPYVIKSTDAGRTWTSISGDLPKKGSAYAFAEDHVDPNLLFVGTEFGAFFTKDGGMHWVKIGGLPTIPIRDLVIQRRENDLVMASFGRGFYVVDDYSPLRTTTAASLTNQATLYPVKDALLYLPTAQYGGAANGFQGELLFSTVNPPYGATFTWYLKDGLKTLKEKRVEVEKAAEKDGKPIRYPTADELRAEAAEEAPAVLLTVSDASGKEVRTITGPVAKGMQRVAWDLHAAGANLNGTGGPFIVPGTYSVRIAARVGGTVKQLAGPVSFSVVNDPASTITLADHQARWTFQEKAQTLGRQVNAAIDVANLSTTKLDQMKRALDATPNAPKTLREQAAAYHAGVNAVLTALRGDVVLGARSDPDPVSIQGRVGAVIGSYAQYLGTPTGMMEQQYGIASDLFTVELAKLKQLAQSEIPALERELEKAGAPYTAGRLPGPP